MSGNDWVSIVLIVALAIYWGAGRYFDHRERMAEIEHGCDCTDDEPPEGGSNEDT